MLVMGFTGTRHGMTRAQKTGLWNTFQNYDPYEFCHGGCIGADAECHVLFQKWSANRGYPIIVYPSNVDRLRALFEVDDNVRIEPPQPPLVRNRDIVNSCHVLVAAPSSAEEEMRSGTWATIRYARKVNRRIVLITPEGTCRYE